MIFQVCIYKNEIAIFDSISRCCVLIGFKTKKDAQKRCDELNKMMSKNKGSK